MRSLLRAPYWSLVARRRVLSQSPRWNSSNSASQAPGGPTSQGEKPNPHRQFYATYGVPLLKVFLGALVTYQGLYLGWLKLEEWEEQKAREEQIRALQNELRSLTKR